MTTPAYDNEMRLPTMLIGSISLVACVLVAIAGGMVSAGREGGSLGDGLSTLIATVPGVLATIGILSIMPAKAPGAWAVPVLGGTMLRALLVLTVALAVYVLLGPDRVVFFLTLLAALMIALIVDVALLVMLISKHQTATGAGGESEGLC